MLRGGTHLRPGLGRPLFGAGVAAMVCKARNYAEAPGVAFIGLCRSWVAKRGWPS
jgi:hypothetical protein